MKNRTAKQKTGDRGERRAALWLFLRGYRILERDYRVGHRDIDVIAKKGGLLVFVEVKTRTDTNTAAPQLAVGSEKRKNLVSAAKYYIATHDTEGMTYRFDVAEVAVNGRIRYIENAFPGDL